MSHLRLETLKSQLQSARKNILFMETEHAKTLHGLHNEIKSLQSKCNDLTLKLVLKEDESVIDYKKKIKNLQIEAARSADEKVSYIQNIEEKDKRILELEGKVKSLDFIHQKNLKAKMHQVTTLAGELDIRATTIAYLTTQLHHAHSKLHRLSNDPAKKVSPKKSPKLLPTPPSGEKRPSHSSRRYKVVTPQKSLNPVKKSAEGKTASSSFDSRRSSRRSSLVKSVPDPTPFLEGQSQNEGLETLEKGESRPKTVLPPITKSQITKKHAAEENIECYITKRNLKKTPTLDVPINSNNEHGTTIQKLHKI